MLIECLVSLSLGLDRFWGSLFPVSSSKYYKAGYHGVVTVRMKSLQFALTPSPKSFESWPPSDSKQV